jgi:hypothetical protein
MTLLILLLMLVVFGKLAVLAFKAAWSMTKILFSIVFLPLALIVILLSGFVYITVPILPVVGILAFVILV